MTERTSARGHVQGVTTYSGGRPSYDNLWVIRFDRAGRAASFSEWFMERT